MKCRFSRGYIRLRQRKYGKLTSGMLMDKLCTMCSNVAHSPSECDFVVLSDLQRLQLVTVTRSHFRKG